MLEVKKSGKSEFGYWAYGVLKYNGFEVVDIFSLNKAVVDGETYKPTHVTLKRNKNNNLRFKLTI